MNFLIPLAVLLCSYCSSFAQFQLNGDAQDLGNNAFELTPAANWMSGSVWYQLRHNLDSNFNISGQLFLGTDDIGADGIVFVMQDRCLSSGTEGGGIGYQNMLGNSIGVEFDTYRNGPGGNFDPEFDHVALHQFGNINHSQANNLAGPVQMHPVKADVEDSIWYDFQIIYNAANTQFDVYFAGSLRISHSIDLKNNIFNGNPYIYWGFTSATGGQNANHMVAISNNTSFSISDDTTCGGATSVLLPPIIPYNLSFNKSITASSVNNGAGGQYDAVNACDMDLNTQWSSLRNDNEWLIVDLGKNIDIDSFIIYWNEAAFEYKIEVSPDSLTWTEVFHETAGNGGVDRIITSAANTRYVKMQGISRLTNAGYSIWEFEIYGLEQYAWTPNDGSIDDTTSNNPTFTPSTTTSYTLEIPDMCAGTVSYTYNVVVDCILLNQPDLNLDARAEKGFNHLQISIEHTEQLEGIYIEKSSDGIDWEMIRWLDAQDVEKQPVFNYQDYNLAPQHNGYYYRLKSILLDGSSQITSSVFVENGSESSIFSIYPIPARDELTIQYPSINANAIRITDCTGKPQNILLTTVASDCIRMDVSKLPAGVYLLYIHQNTVRKIVVY